MVVCVAEAVIVRVERVVGLCKCLKVSEVVMVAIVKDDVVYLQLNATCEERDVELEDEDKWLDETSEENNAV